MCDLNKINQLKRQSFDFSNRFKSADPLSVFNKSNVTSAGLTYSDLMERADKIFSCSTVVELKEEFTGPPDNMEQIFQVTAANFCKQHVVCPICSNRSQARRQARFDDPIKQQAIAVMEGNKHAYLFTYTIADGENLKERLNHLKESKRYFRLQGQKRVNGRSCGEAGKIKAAVSTIEIKRGDKSGLWHTHIHELVFTDKPIDYKIYDPEQRRKLYKKFGDNIPKEELSKIALRRALFKGERVPVSKISAEWLKATSGDSISLHVDKMHHIPRSKTIYYNGQFKKVLVSAKKRKKLSQMSFEESIAYQAKESLKYITKPSENNPLDFVEIIDSTYNKRLVSTYGEFRAIPVDDYNDETGENNTFMALWNPVEKTYGNVVAGKIREVIEEIEGHKARSECAILTGQYRRRRKELLSTMTKAGNVLSNALDDTKKQYRSRVGSVWALYRQAVDYAKRVSFEDCDKYSPTLALAGAWIPGSDRRTIYGMIFS